MLWATCHISITDRKNNMNTHIQFGKKIYTVYTIYKETQRQAGFNDISPSPDEAQTNLKINVKAVTFINVHKEK